MIGHKALLLRMGFVVLLAILGSLFFKSVFDDSGLIHGQRLKLECDKKLEEVIFLEKKNQELRREILELRKKKSRRLEMLGRAEFGMAKPGEIVFSFPKTPTTEDPVPVAP